LLENGSLDALLEYARFAVTDFLKDHPQSSLFERDSEGRIALDEGARFWAGVLNEIRNRGVEDILVACMDGLPTSLTRCGRCFLTPISSAVLSIWCVTRRGLPRTKTVCADLKAIYTAPSEDVGRAALDAFGVR
jgi:transposase-like protein